VVPGRLPAAAATSAASAASTATSAPTASAATSAPTASTAATSAAAHAASTTPAASRRGHALISAVAGLPGRAAAPIRAAEGASSVHLTGRSTTTIHLLATAGPVSRALGDVLSSPAVPASVGIP
jgi:hypothetical protein